MKKILSKKVYFVMSCLIILHLFYIFSTCLVNMIPGEVIRENTIESATILNQEGLYPTPLKTNIITVKWDNYTTAILYGKFICSANMPSVASFVRNDILVGGVTPLDSLTNYILNNGTSKIGNYARYWMGSEIFLRPLSVFFNVSEIRGILFFISTLLLFYIGIMMYKNLSIEEAVAFVSVICISGMYFNGMCLTYCWELFVSLGAVLVELIVFKNVESFKKYEALFFILLGSVTMFFTWLSYPMVTLGIALIIIITLRGKYIENHSVFDLVRVLFDSLCWCIGYAITMEVKAIICMVTGIESTAESRILTLIGNGDFSSRIRVVNMRMFGDMGFYNSNILVLLIMAIIVILCSAYVRKKLVLKFKTNEIFLYFFVCLYPCVWHFIIANHSEIHGASAMLHVISAYGFVKVIMCLFISSGKCEEDKRIKRKKWVQS